jgi:hypothetical protein
MRHQHKQGEGAHNTHIHTPRVRPPRPSMTYFHFINCAALTFLPHLVIYKATKLYVLSCLLNLDFLLLFKRKKHTMQFQTIIKLNRKVCQIRVWSDTSGTLWFCWLLVNSTRTCTLIENKKENKLHHFKKYCLPLFCLFCSWLLLQL